MFKTSSKENTKLEIQHHASFLRDGDPDVRCRALDALASLLASLRENKDLMAEWIPLLVSLLCDSNGNVRLSAAFTLRSLSVNSELGTLRPANRDLIVRGAIPLLKALLQDSDEARRASAIQVLDILAAPYEAKEGLLTAEAGAEVIPLLVPLLRDSNKDVKGNAIEALKTLACNHPANRGLIVDAGAIPLLVSLLRDSPRRATVEALMYLASGNPANQGLIAKAGAIPLLVSLLRNSRDPYGVEKVISALQVLAGNHPANQGLIEEAGAIPLLIELRSSRDRVHLYAKEALRQFSDAKASTSIPKSEGASVSASVPPPPLPEAVISRTEFEAYIARLVPGAAVTEATRRNPAERAKRLQEEYIERDPMLRDYYLTLKAVLYQTFMAMLVIKSGLVDAKAIALEGYVGYATTGLEFLVEGIPIVSQVVKGLGAIADQVIALKQANRLTRLAELLPNPEDLAEVVGRVARHLTIGLEADIKTIREDLPSFRKSFTDWLKQLKERFVLDEIDNLYKAKGLEHATVIIALGMAGALTLEVLNSLELLLKIKPGLDLEALKARLEMINREENRVVVAASGAAGGGSSSSSASTASSTPFAIVDRVAQLEKDLAAESRERKMLARRVGPSDSSKSGRTGGDGEGQQQAQGFAPPIADKDAMKVLQKTVATVNRLERTMIDVETGLGYAGTHLQEDRERTDPILFERAFRTRSFDFEVARDMIRHIADNHFGRTGHRLSRNPPFFSRKIKGSISITQELQGPAAHPPPRVTGEAILNVLGKNHLASVFDIPTLQKQLETSQIRKEAGDAAWSPLCL